MDNYGRNQNHSKVGGSNSKNYRNKGYKDENNEYKPFTNNMSDSFKNYDDYYGNKKNSNKKQDQNFFAAKGGNGGYQQQQQNRDYRQASEPRTQPNSFDKGGYMNSERGNRDTRSVEANKPPIGRRNSNPKASLMDNYRLLQSIKSIPPRFQRQKLSEFGMTWEDFEKLEEMTQSQPPPLQPPPHQQQNNWTNTMPIGGRGNKNQHRFDHHHQQNQNQQQRYNNNYHHNKHQQNYYQNDYDNNFRSLTPPLRNRGDNSYDNKHQNHFRNDWKHSGNSRYDDKTPPLPQQQHDNGGNNVSPKFTADSKFDWSEDVENASMPHDVNNFSPKSNVNSESSGSRNKNRRRRNRSASSNGSNADHHYYKSDNKHQEQDVFKAPYQKSGNQRQRRNSQSSYNSRENSMERGFTNYSSSRDNSLDRRHRRPNRYNNSHNNNNNNNNNRNRRSSDYSSSRENSTERYSNWNRNENVNSWRSADPSNVQKIAELTKQFEHSVDLNKGGVLTLPHQPHKEPERPPERKEQRQEEQRILFDPKNPSRPIVVTQTNTRPRDIEVQDVDLTHSSYMDQQQYNSASKPLWYNHASKQYNSIHKKHLIDNLEQYDRDLQQLVDNGELFQKWEQAIQLREKIQKLLEGFLVHEMKFCMEQNVEHYFWKLLFYNIIELMKKRLNETNVESEESFLKEKLFELIDNGTKYFENLLTVLEKTYSFDMEKFTGQNAGNFSRGLGYLGCALISAQKIFLFLGDLARYREQINPTKQNNFGKAKQYYIKAQQIVPRNGRPYNQLALLSVYSKRKIDAVYFYMRSLMSANPFLSARESMIALFDEIRKKYESSQRKREEKNRLRLKEKEHRFDGHLRKETWVHPEDGCRVHRTAPLDPFAGRNDDSSEDEELQQLGPSELNKRFITSFLHIQGKLITKIGMESFQTCSVQMLREFRALLQHTPIAITSHRLLQLISLNMYAINCTQLKDPAIASFARSQIQECAISIGLLMFGIILERFIQLLKESVNANKTPILSLSGSGAAGGDVASGKKRNSTSNSSDKTETLNKSVDSNTEPKKILTLTEDSKEMLPAIKVWCDWMHRHVNVWNPPPSCSDYKFGTTTNHDPWHGLANLMTLLEKVDTNRDILLLKQEKDSEIVRLPEDITLAGFTPLVYNTPEPIYCPCDIDIDVAQNVVRLEKVRFFGTTFLCSCTPPILKNVKLPLGAVEYVSIVQNRVDSSDSEILLESFSDEETETAESKNNQNNTNNTTNNTNADSQTSKVKSEDENCDKLNDDLNSHQDAAEIRKLLRRKDELERKQKMQQKYNERLQDILSQSTVALHIEVRPRFLIPDTNCFVDYIDEIKAIANAHPLYQLMIPIVVINELEGLSRGIKQPSPSGAVSAPLIQSLQLFSTESSTSTRVGNRNDPQHAAMVANASKSALTFLKSKNPAVKCVTTKGSILNSSVFTSEDDHNEQKSNDDKILETALNLCKKSVEEKRGDVRHLMREVVLLTTDRNLRVKALSNDLPVRELPDFVKWAGLSG